MVPQPKLLVTPRTYSVVGAHVLIDIISASALCFVPPPQIAKPLHNWADADLKLEKANVVVSGLSQATAVTLSFTA